MCSPHPSHFLRHLNVGSIFQELLWNSWSRQGSHTAARARAKRRNYRHVTVSTPFSNQQPEKLDPGGARSAAAGSRDMYSHSSRESAMRLPTKDSGFSYNGLSHLTQSQFRPYISLSQRIVRRLLLIFPSAFKSSLYSVLARASSFFGKSPYRHIFRLPFNLVLKTSVRSRLVEADALRFVGSLNGINAPVLIDSASTPQITYILSTWVDGDCCSEVWEQLTSVDKEKIVEDLRSQFGALRLQTATHDHDICNASGDAIEDPRVPWLADDPRVFTSYCKFMEQVWLGLNFPRNRDTLYPLLKPFVERNDLPVVFSHGDLLPKNLIFPGGLDQWRRDHRPLCIVDWEYAGWMPLPWEALKATWLLYDPGEDWYKMVAEVFPESRTELEMDWQWRTRSGIPIV